MATGLAHIQYGDHYPLVNPSDDIKYLIVDMVVSHRNPSWEYALPLRIKQFNRTTGMLVLVNDDNREIFRGQCDASEVWGGDYKIFKWANNETVIKIVINNNVQTLENLYPQQAIVDLRAVWCYPKHVLTINTHKGDFVLAAGHNIDLYNDGNSFHIDAVAGAGEGAYKHSCQNERKNLAVKSINGVKPDENGAIFLTTENGPQITAECHKLIIQNPNQPCCLCSDMCNFAEYLKSIVHEILLTRAKAEWLRDMYKKQLEYWNALPVCTAAEAIYIQLDPGPCPYVKATMRVMNINKLPGTYKVEATISGGPMLDIISEIEPEIEEADEPMLVWVSEVAGKGIRSYPRPAPIVMHTNAGGGPKTLKIEGCIPPGGSMFVSGKYTVANSLKKVHHPTEPVEITLTVTDGSVTFSDNTSGDLDSAYLSGKKEVKGIIDCGALPQDTIYNKEGAEEVNKLIWEAKQEFWPCEPDVIYFGHQPTIGLQKIPYTAIPEDEEEEDD